MRSTKSLGKRAAKSALGISATLGSPAEGHGVCGSSTVTQGYLVHKGYLDYPALTDAAEEKAAITSIMERDFKETSEIKGEVQSGTAFL